MSFQHRLHQGNRCWLLSGRRQRHCLPARIDWARLRWVGGRDWGRPFLVLPLVPKQMLGEEDKRGMEVWALCWTCLWKQRMRCSRCEDHVFLEKYNPFLGNGGEITVSNQKDHDAAKTSCIQQCNARVSAVGRVYVGIRRIDINKFECKCLSRESGDIIGRPYGVTGSDVRSYIQCAELIPAGISFFDSDSDLKKYLTESKKTLRTSDGQWEGTEPNICNSSQVQTLYISTII